MKLRDTIAVIIQRRLVDPEEFASKVLYLASEDARVITRQAVNVCRVTVFC